MERVSIIKKVGKVKNNYDDLIFVNMLIISGKKLIYITVVYIMWQCSGSFINNHTINFL